MARIFITGSADGRALGRKANEAGPFQAVLHTGIYRPSAGRGETVDGLDDVFAINALAPYLLTALIEGPSGIRPHYPERVSGRLRTVDRCKACVDGEDEQTRRTKTNGRHERIDH